MAGLGFAEIEDRHQAFASFSGLLRGTDDGNDIINIHDGDEQALNQVQAIFALGQAVRGASAYDIQTVVNIYGEQLAQTHGAWLAVDQCDVVDAEGIFHRSVLVQAGKNRVRIEPVLQFDNQLQAVMAVGKVNDIGDAGDLLVIDAVLDLFDDLFGAYAVGSSVTTKPDLRAEIFSKTTVARVRNNPRPVR